MMKLPISPALTITLFITTQLVVLPSTTALGGAATLAVSYGTATVCGLVAAQTTQHIQCYSRGQILTVQPKVSFSSIAAGRTSLCGLRSGGHSLHCWKTNSENFTLNPKRVYYNDTVLLENLTIGDDQVCATVIGTGTVNCWRDDNFSSSTIGDDQFVSISSGFGFSCGILKISAQIRCWGNSSIAGLVENGFRNMTMVSVVAGGSHVCGLNSTGFLICKGNNDSGQLNAPPNSAWQFSKLALGENHSCGIRRINRSVVCWGSGGDYSETEGISFESIVSGSNFTCGLSSRNLSIICWGSGFPTGSPNSSLELPLPEILPGPCVGFQNSCSCGIFPQSQRLCYDSGNICRPCENQIVTPKPLVPIAPSPSINFPTSSPSKGLTRGLLAFAIIGSVGLFSGICTLIYCWWTGTCFGNKKIHSSVQPTITRGNSNGGTTTTTSNNSPPSRSSTIRRQSSRAMRRQRSGTSSKHADRAEEFSLAELASATNNFSLENKIGAGSFGVVYRGKLSDGREVAIKRSEMGLRTKKFQEQESAFESELAFLSRLHHKHLVRLVGYCEEKDERLLVYEHMKNGALHDLLHGKNNVEKSSSVLNSWKIRIKIALDAARGIEYLHNYAVPSIIHRDIKSSNILLDSNWIARVSDFGLSLMGPETERDYRPMKAAGTVGYIDPEYYGLNVLTAKSDVYGLGVVLLELLTGKRAIFKNAGNGGAPISVVDFAVPAILAGEVVRVLDERVGAPEMNEAEAVELVAYTAMHCVNLEGKERPTMTDIVANLERALALCDESHGSISSASISIVSV